MSGSRPTGRYNLHRLGWSAFEDLCMQIMRVVLGETCTRFPTGRDQGRDGWFRGTATHLLASQNHLSGNFVIQCKHTSKADHPLNAEQLKQEVEKVKAIAADAPCHYLLMTNRQITAQRESEIRATFEAVEGVETCLVLGEAWIEDTIDGSPRLLRVVPRLYGIGDLSQILSSVIQRQSAALLEDLADSLRTFVPTDSYRRAETALHDHGFAVLVGPPASGKSAIAANLCMVNIAQNANVRVLRIEDADQFKNTWSPVDKNTIYWVDDVFGETTLDDRRLRDWSAALEKVEAARRRDARILFCTRDYILSAAERRLKKSKSEIVNDARVRVDVASLSDSEKAAILYNHVKHGDLPTEQKRLLKPHLSALALLQSFTPELARRLGRKRFHQGLTYTSAHLQRFFENPVQHFQDVIHGLSDGETAALAVCLLSSNSVPDPVPDDAITEAVLKTYSVSMQQVREAFELLEGSLMKRTRAATTQAWQAHHPSMIEALQVELQQTSSRLLLYLQSAKLRAILRDTTTIPPNEDSRLVFLSDSVYRLVIDRLCSACQSESEAIAEYLLTRASDKFLLELDTACPEVILRALEVAPEPDGSDVSPKLAVRLAQIENGNLIDDERQDLLVSTLQEGVSQSGWVAFVKIAGLRELLPWFFREFVDQEIESGFPSMERLYDWYSQDLSSTAHVDSAIEGLSSNASNLEDSLLRAGRWTEALHLLKETHERLQRLLQERRIELESEEDERASLNQERWQEQRMEERYELEYGRFADVDE